MHIVKDTQAHRLTHMCIHPYMAQEARISVIKEELDYIYDIIIM